jgi:monoamine oxidase
MPTGYTAEFEKRDIPFNEFVWQCARAFGALIHMRDDSLDAEIELPKICAYHAEALEKATEDLVKYNSISKEQAEPLMRAERESTVTYAKEALERHRVLRDRYTKMINQVASWTPPTSDHNQLKTFMLEQLNSSIQYDCNDEYYLKQLMEPPRTVDSWIDDKIKIARRDVEYHTKELAKDKGSYQNAIDWVTQLQKSVPLVKG